MTDENPKLFISYSWSNPEHEKWVINLAAELVESGVDVIFDKWDLKEGQDAIAYMEKMVSDPDIKKVIMICDKKYAEKADGRSGGVGTETQIISPEIYQKQDQNKFVAVISEKDENGNAYVPIYYKSRIYIDMSNEALYTSNFEQLLRWIYDKPVYVKPPLGKTPSFLSESNHISLGTTVKFNRAFDSIQQNKEYANASLGDYLNTVVENLENFRITENNGEFDDHVIESIEKFLPYRNELISIFLSTAQYRDTPATIKQLHRFFESLIPYMDKPLGVTSWKDSDFDNFRFIIVELFLHVISCLIKYERFQSVSYLLNKQYFVESNAEYGRPTMVPFTVFQDHIRSLDIRNTRLNLRKLSLEAQLLIERCKTLGIHERQLIQSDFVLFIRNSLDALKSEIRQRWIPVTMIYAERYSGPFEIFARAQSAEYFASLKCIFNIDKKDELVPLFEAFRDEKLFVPRWQFTSFDPAAFMNYDKLATSA